MPRKAREPLDPRGREIRFYKGDWERLSEMLAPKKITPSEYLREMVARKLRAIEEQVPRTAVEEIEL